MRLKKQDEPFFLDGFSYTQKEVNEAKKIRAIGDATRKEMLAKCFEVETGKKFPWQKTIKFGTNLSTALVSSLESERMAVQVLLNPRTTRTIIPLE